MKLNKVCYRSLCMPFSLAKSASASSRRLQGKSSEGERCSPSLSWKGRRPCSYLPARTLKHAGICHARHPRIFPPRGRAGVRFWPTMKRLAICVAAYRVRPCPCTCSLRCAPVPRPPISKCAWEEGVQRRGRSSPLAASTTCIFFLFARSKATCPLGKGEAPPLRAWQPPAAINIRTSPTAMGIIYESR